MTENAGIASSIFVNKIYYFTKYSKKFYQLRTFIIHMLMLV